MILEELIILYLNPSTKKRELHTNSYCNSVNVNEIYLLNRKTLLVKFTSRNGVHSVYLYRLVEDDSSP